MEISETSSKTCLILSKTLLWIQPTDWHQITFDHWPFTLFHCFLLVDWLGLATEVDADTHEYTAAINEVTRDVNNNEEDEKDDNNDSYHSSRT